MKLEIQITRPRTYTEHTLGLCPRSSVLVSAQQTAQLDDVSGTMQKMCGKRRMAWVGRACTWQGWQAASAPDQARLVHIMNALPFMHPPRRETLGLRHHSARQACVSRPVSPPCGTSS